jgi:UDP-N-acetylmuramoylalanine--D-glutamate ligase
MLVDRAFDDELDLIPVADVRPEGPSGVADAMAAAALARAHGVSAEAIAAGLRGFKPIAHRAEAIAELGGVCYVNDSKATNPHAAASSLRGYEHVVWIAGGLLKGANVDDLVTEAAARLSGVVLIGADREVIATALARHAPDVPVHTVPTGEHGAMAVMSEAVRLASALAKQGDTVLLAPAAASMDMFTDYQHRGRAFAEAVLALPVPGAP